MNAVVRQTDFVSTAEPRRHRFTFDDVLAIQAAGLLGDVRAELVDGDIIDRPADGDLHRDWTDALLRWLLQNFDRHLYAFVSHTTLNAGDGWFSSPDFYFYSSDLTSSEVRVSNVLLVVEESDSSLALDLGEKATRYSQAGVRDYWAIDLNARRIHVHRDPGPDGYRSVEAFERDQPVAALLIPGLTLRLADLPRVG